MKEFLPGEITSGKKGADCMTTVITLLNKINEGKFLGSFDYSQCFDYIDPEIAIAHFAHLGLPVDIAKLLASMWTQQARYLQYGGVTSSTPCQAGASTPQGDPWAMLATAVVLLAPLRDLTRTFPNVTATIYADD